MSSSKQTKQYAADSEAKDSASPPKAPRPPTPPRRHTLAEICRYADEQCAYIEWMTRKLEAEEAARRHSSPTTPIGAITNPFSGPADMWWRPISANEMYGKSAMRRLQEEEQEKAQKQNPYLVMNEFPDLVERHPRDTNRVRDALEMEEPSKETTPDLVSDTTSETEEMHGVECSSALNRPTEAHLEYFGATCGHRTGLRDARAPAGRRSSRDDTPSDLPRSEQSSVMLMIPKALLCFLFLPLVLVVVWYSHGCNEEGEEIEDEEEDRGRKITREHH